MGFSAHDRLLTEGEVSDRLGLSKNALAKLRMTPGAGPAFIKIGRRVRYPEGSVAAFVEARVHLSTRRAA